MTRPILALCLLTACGPGRSGGGTCDNSEDPIYAFATGAYTTTLNADVPQAILDAYGDPAPGPIVLDLTETTATMTYETVDGEAVEVVLSLGTLGTAELPL